MAEETMTFRVDGELKEAFKRAAKERNRNASILLRDFMRDYVLKVGKPSQLRVPADKQVDDEI